MATEDAYACGAKNFMNLYRVVCGVALAGAFAISACSNMSFESNLDPNNFVEYAKPATVDVYTQESIQQHRYHSLGVVTGLACQETEDDYVALPEDARTDAKIKIADMGGNGVVFHKCVRLEKTAACAVSVTCYGEAFVVDDNLPKISK